MKSISCIAWNLLFWSDMGVWFGLGDERIMTDGQGVETSERPEWKDCRYYEARSGLVVFLFFYLDDGFAANIELIAHRAREAGIVVAIVVVKTLNGPTQMDRTGHRPHVVSFPEPPKLPAIPHHSDRNTSPLSPAPLPSSLLSWPHPSRTSRLA
jgi:hypothetical protein